MQKPESKFKKCITFPIFESRWMLVLFYYGLILAQMIYAVKFLQNIYKLIIHFWTDDYAQVMLAVLELVDIAMIANLTKMVTSGSYQSFIEKVPQDHTEHVTSGALKVKMATSLVMVSGINLLQPFVDTTTYNNRDIIVKIAIHITFLISALGLGFNEYLHAKCKQWEKDEEPEEKPLANEV